MKDLDKKITKLGVLYKKGCDKGVTREENREFKKLEKSITNSMLKDEVLFDLHIVSFRQAINQ